jgi:hypothetical protein
MITFFYTFFKKGVKFGVAPDGLRTHYLTLTKRMLYQLSYKSILEGGQLLMGFEPTTLRLRSVCSAN